MIDDYLRVGERARDPNSIAEGAELRLDGPASTISFLDHLDKMLAA